MSDIARESGSGEGTFRIATKYLVRELDSPVSNPFEAALGQARDAASSSHTALNDATRAALGSFKTVVDATFVLSQELERIGRPVKLMGRHKEALRSASESAGNVQSSQDITEYNEEVLGRARKALNVADVYIREIEVRARHNFAEAGSVSGSEALRAGAEAMSSALVDPLKAQVGKIRATLGELGDILTENLLSKEARPDQ